MGRFNTGANGCSRVWSPHKHDDQLIKEGQWGSSSGLSFCIGFFFYEEVPPQLGVGKLTYIFKSVFFVSHIHISSLSFIGCVVARV